MTGDDLVRLINRIIDERLASHDFHGQLTRELEWERRRPVPPPGGWPKTPGEDEGRHRLNWVATELGDLG
jgi:hypothetical protein